MGLKTLVREDLKLRGLSWNKKSPPAQPNHKEAARLARRQNAFNNMKPADQQAHTMPGSYRK